LAALYSVSFLRIIFLMFWFIHGIFHLDVMVFDGMYWSINDNNNYKCKTEDYQEQAKKSLSL
jgi:hypothetical protein